MTIESVSRKLIARSAERVITEHSFLLRPKHGLRQLRVTTSSAPASEHVVEIEQLRAGFVRYFEIDNDAVTAEQMTKAISRTLARWPANESSDGIQNA